MPTLRILHPTHALILFLPGDNDFTHLMILTSWLEETLPIEPGVMRTNCLPIEYRAASIYCSLSEGPPSNSRACTHHLSHTNFSVDTIHEDIAALCQFSASHQHVWDTYNSSRHRTGAPMASHSDRRRQMVEKDFSPPDRVFASRPLPTLVGSGST